MYFMSPVSKNCLVKNNPPKAVIPKAINSNGNNPAMLHVAVDPCIGTVKLEVLIVSVLLLSAVE